MSFSLIQNLDCEKMLSIPGLAFITMYLKLSDQQGLYLVYYIYLTKKLLICSFDVFRSGVAPQPEKGHSPNLW